MEELIMHGGVFTPHQKLQADTVEIYQLGI